ncbi:MAG: hypothetical protein QM757_17400 [Paludibaculum sp.]
MKQLRNGLARRGSAKLATLHRNLGLALLRLRNEPAEAARVLQEGLNADQLNPAVYEALDQALSIRHGRRRNGQRR